MKKIYTLLFLAGTLAASSCDKKKEEVKPASTIVNIMATMTGTTQAPQPNSSTASGTFVGTYDTQTREINYVLRYKGMTPTAGHFHQGAPGVAGPLSVPFPQLNDPIVGKAVLSVEDGQKLMGSAFYANLHSSQYPGGELRGDIMIMP